ncbi:hypothetical protein [Flavobacterium ajazii]|uniref:hypothetical protein n=1 Tax=Flavobacterium ajazii TaxID=2692318 RepID=UPI0013D2E3BC|nr:hypothetical protein [Flavobacterium ajazii]
MPYTQSIVEEACLHFDKLKEVMDKHPNAFQMEYIKEDGYVLSINLDLIEPPLSEQD